MIPGYDEVWALDFEFYAPDGERPIPLCLVAKEIVTGRIIHIRLLGSNAPVPFRTDSRVLFVAYYSSAEWGCFIALGWPLPVRVLDLYAEFRCYRSGLGSEFGFGLLGALMAHGITHMGSVEKETMRNLARRGGPYSEAEQQALLEYCQADVEGVELLLHAMLSKIELAHALLRGRYMVAAARMEWNGVPVDIECWEMLQQHWPHLQMSLVEEIDKKYGVYEGKKFKRDRFGQFLIRENIPWPRLPSGALALDAETFREMARAHPRIAPLRELRHTMSQMRLSGLTIGSDGHNRLILSAFASKTGRNQPSNTKFIFGPSVWLRGLIKPEAGMALAYVDWSQQEFGIAAALSGDTAMMDAYASGDPYLTFAKQAGAVPPDATKNRHKEQREQFKQAALAVQYGMGEASLAMRIGSSQAKAKELLRLHRQTYPRFWEWSEGVVNFAMAYGFLFTVFGWRVHVGAEANPRSLMNFPMQANGAEMLRLACCIATERGITVCAPVHDALLIEGAENDIENVVAETQRTMREASAIVLNGFELRSDAKIVRYPDRYMDDRGRVMWDTVMRLSSTASGKQVNR